MTDETCGRCWRSLKYGDELTDPFEHLDDEHKAYAHESWCICTLEGEWPLVLPIDQDPAEIPCDFWEA